MGVYFVLGAVFSITCMERDKVNSINLDEPWADDAYPFFYRTTQPLIISDVQICVPNLADFFFLKFVWSFHSSAWALMFLAESFHHLLPVKVDIHFFPSFCRSLCICRKSSESEMNLLVLLTKPGYQCLSHSLISLNMHYFTWRLSHFCWWWGLRFR